MILYTSASVMFVDSRRRSTALKAAELLSQFVHSNIENDNLTIAMSYIHNSIRDCFYNKMKKQKQTKITDYLQ